MASPHPFHERPGPVSDTARSFSLASALAYAFCSLAVSLVSMVKIAS